MNTLQTKKLGEILKLEYGKPLPDLKRKTNGKYPVYGANGEKNRSNEFYFDKPSIIVGRKGSAGELNLTEEKFWPLDVTYFVTFDDKKYDLKFLYNLLKTLELPKLAKGVKPGINRNEVYSIEVNVPSLAEQKRSVRILDEAFEKLQKVKENTEKNIQNSLDLFESYSRVAFNNPGNWSNKVLGEVCNLYQGIAINAKTRHALVDKSDLPLLRIKDLKHNTVEQYIDPNNFPKNALVNESDLIYTRTGQIGLVFTGKRGVLHNNSFKIIPNDTLSREYLFYWLQNPTFKSKIVSLASRAAQPDITHTLFKQQPISIPTLSEQKSIVKKLDQLSEETKKLESIYQDKFSAIEELKKSILSKAFSRAL